MLKLKTESHSKTKKDLRAGYTTGACAAAASKAAAIALLTGKGIDMVEITLPAGKKVLFKIYNCQFKDREVTCSIIKDAGDDPDVTHGAEICATVTLCEEPGIVVEGGEGVGVVTRPGLGLDIGGPAINPVPRRMITDSVYEIITQNRDVRGVRVIISAPEGRELAKRTLNPRLGILGGISILGTTGLVIPYSTTAFKSCIAIAINVAIANGNKHLVLTTGGRSEAFAQRQLSLPDTAFIQMGDWVGFALRACARKGVINITICGMIGKLSKIASGQLQTHALRSRINVKFLASIASRLGALPELVKRLQSAYTARHIYELMPHDTATQFYNEICRLACYQSWIIVKGAMSVECMMTDFDGKRLLGRSILNGNETSS